MTRYTKDGRIWVLSLVVCMTMGLMQPVQAQTRAQRSTAVRQMYAENHIVSLVPVPVFFDGFRVDYDVRIKDNLWLNVAPQVNYRRKLARPEKHYKYFKVNDPFSDENKLPVYTLNLTGMSLKLNLRYYQPRENSDIQKTSGLYYAVGIGMDYNQHHRLSSRNEAYDVNTMRIGSQAYIGYMGRMWPKATFDFYFGGAWRYAIHSFSQPEYKALLKMDPIRPWTYLYSGVFLEAGIRIGFVL